MMTANEYVLGMIIFVLSVVIIVMTFHIKINKHIQMMDERCSKRNDKSNQLYELLIELLKQQKGK